MEYKEKKRRLENAKSLLLAGPLTVEAFQKLREILYGVHLDLDDTLHILDVHAKELVRLLGDSFLKTPFEQMPSTTQEEVHSKQLVAEFGEGLKKLQNQLVGIMTELDSTHEKEVAEKKKWHFYNPFAFLKGPIVFFLGSVAFVVAMLYFTSSQLFILNNGCAPIPPMFQMPTWIPGFSIPQTPISPGEKAYAVLPGFMYNVDATYQGAIAVRVYFLNFTFDVTRVDDVQFDGETILGRAKNLSAFLSGDHFLEIICKQPQS